MNVDVFPKVLYFTALSLFKTPHIYPHNGKAQRFYLLLALFIPMGILD